MARLAVGDDRIGQLWAAVLPRYRRKVGFSLVGSFIIDVK